MFAKDLCPRHGWQNNTFLYLQGGNDGFASERSKVVFVGSSNPLDQFQYAEAFKHSTDFLRALSIDLAFSHPAL
jgi:hypothetical protein